MSLPKEPRQLMINLMYLVLTAMLALNVSSEILHAFKVINESIGSSNASINEKNAKIYEALNDQESQPGQKERVKPYNDRAKIAKQKSEDLVKYLEKLKEDIIQQAGGRDDDGEIKSESDIDAATRLMVEQKEGEELRNRLTTFRNELIGLVSKDSKDQIARDLPVKIQDVEKSDNNPQGDWSWAYFHNMPTMAAVTLLSKFQNDVRNSEAVVVTELMNEAGAEQLKFDAIKAIAIPTTTYALEGQKIEAQILLAAYNKNLEPTINLTSGGGRITEIEAGVGKYETTASGIGLKTVKGTVSIDMGGVPTTENFSFEYMVGSTGASMQLDKMNVFYIGVPNPITVSAAGYSIEDISVNIEGAEVKQNPEGGKGQYLVTVTKPGTIQAKILANTENGRKEVGGMPVRVKYIPDPIAKVGGVTGGRIPTNQFKAQIGILAALDNFDFAARFVVSSYQFSVLPKRGEFAGPYTVEGPYLGKDNATVKELIDRLAPGDRVYLEEIRAKGPDGVPRKLGAVNLVLE